MVEPWPWSNILPMSVCTACWQARDCYAFAQGPLCFVCGSDLLDAGYIAQYLVWKEVRRLCVLLEHPCEKVG
mgnify:FL=1